LSYAIVREFLSDLKEEFCKGDDKTIKIAKLKKVEQRSKMIEEFVQEFGKATRRSGYERWPLMEKFKRDMNGVIW